MKLYFQAREVELEIGSNGDGEGYFSAGNFVDGDTRDLTDAELDELADLYPEVIDEEIFQSAIMAAEYAFEGDR